MRVLVHREDQGNNNPQYTPPPPALPPASYAIYSYLQYLTPALHGTTRNEFSVWSHVNKGIKRQAKLPMNHFLFPLWRNNKVFFLKHMWGVKQQNYRRFLVIVAVFLRMLSCRCDLWAVKIHKNILSFCKYLVKRDKRELDMVNIMPFSAVHIPSFQPNGARQAHRTVPKLSLSFYHYK